ncbi:MAG: D-inositol-3-phosphate glycosyltransferase [Actinomycetes bacterium]
MRFGLRHDDDVPHGSIARGIHQPRRIAMLSVHTSPLDQAGTGDAGGMNVYLVELSRRLAAAGIKVDIFTRANRRGLDPVVQLTDGVLVRHLESGPLQDMQKQDLPAQLCSLTAGVLRAEAARPQGWYDAIHSHYWLSGQVGLVASERWNVPLIHSMHTMARVKNNQLALGDDPEPKMRIIGEQQVVDVSDRLIANTADEFDDLVQLYDANPSQVSVVHPGVDLERFSPDSTTSARARLGLDPDLTLLLFVGRIQPLKGPDVLIRATARLVADSPALREKLLTVVCGGPSGAGPERLDELRKLAADLGVADIIRFEPPACRDNLTDWYRAADLVCIPSYSESFGLVAVEAQACGTPVVAAAVGGLHTAVADGRSGILIDGHNPADWSATLTQLIAQPRLREALSSGAREHASRFSWNTTASATIDVYRRAIADRNRLLVPSRSQTSA